MTTHVISWPAEKFRAVVRACLVAASTDAERPNLMGVYFCRENGVLSVSATDGTWLLRWTEPEGQTNENGEKQDRTPFARLIPRRVLESFVDATKKCLELERVNLILPGDGPGCLLETILDVRRFEFLPVPEPFPPVANVIPKTVKPKGVTIGVGADMLSRVAKAFSLATGDNETSILWQMTGGEESPLVCTSETHPEILAVVMPRRTGANAVPEAAQ